MRLPRQIEGSEGLREEVGEADLFARAGLVADQDRQVVGELQEGLAAEAAGAGRGVVSVTTATAWGRRRPAAAARRWRCARRRSRGRGCSSRRWPRRGSSRPPSGSRRPPGSGCRARRRWRARPGRRRRGAPSPCGECSTPSVIAYGGFRSAVRRPITSHPGGAGLGEHSPARMPPADGQEIVWHADEDRLEVPDRPIIPFIEGDGTGPDIWRATRRVLDGAVESCYGGARSIAWFEVLAGEKAHQQTGEWLPDDTLEAIRALPRRHQGTADDAGRRRHPQPERHPAPGARPLRLRAAGALLPGRALAGARAREGGHGDLPREHGGRLRRHRVAGGLGGGREDHRVPRRDGQEVRPDSGIGIKPISVFGSKRLVRKALQYAVACRRKSVTLVHKGNIMKFTEGAFKDWGYEVAREKFGDRRSPRTRSGPSTAARRRGAQGRGQGPHRRLDVPAGPAAAGRVRRPRHHEPERRLPLGRPGRPGRRPRHGAGQQRGRRLRRLRGHPRHRPQVRQPGQGQPGLADPLGRA